MRILLRAIWFGRKKVRGGETGGSAVRAGLVSAAINPVAVENVADGLHVATTMAREAEHAKQQQQVPKLQRRLQLCTQVAQRKGNVWKRCLSVEIAEYLAWGWNLYQRVLRFQYLLAFGGKQAEVTRN